jgi:hypothetical protein
MGYRNCELMPPPTEVLDDDTDCVPVIGEWQDDGLTMYVGGAAPGGGLLAIYNERRPLLNRDPAPYSINRIDPRPGAEPFSVEFTCLPDRASPFNGMVLRCPSP